MNERPVLSCRQSRELDRRAVERYGMSTLVLMENAGRGTVDKLLELALPPPFVVCCGKGNNGGDGFVVARHLDARGFPVTVLLAADPTTLAGDALTNWRILLAAGAAMSCVTRDPAGAGWHQTLREAGTLIDGLLGTGSAGEPRSPLAEVIDAMNASGRPILAVDLPSGLDADTGEAASRTVRAAHTCTFGTLKPGLIVPAAAAFTGQVHVVSLGVPSRLIDELAAGS